MEQAEKWRAKTSGRRLDVAAEESLQSIQSARSSRTHRVIKPHVPLGDYKKHRQQARARARCDDPMTPPTQRHDMV